MERNAAHADCPPVCLKADCLPNRANTKLRRQPDEVQPVADNEKLDMSSLVAMMTNTTLEREFQSVQPFSQTYRTPTVAKEFLIGLDDPAEADWELFCNSWSAGFLGERLYGAR